MESNTPQPNSIQRFLSSELLLAALITVMTIVTAITAYQGSLAEGESLNQFFVAQSELTDASLLYLEQGQEIFYDHNVYDQYQIALLNGEEAIADYYLDQLSEPGTAAVERANGKYPFTPDYEAELFAEAAVTVEDMEDAYELAMEFNVKGDRLGLVTTILAVGLAFSAWGALAPEESRQRMLFALLSLVALGLAIIEYVRILAA